MSNTIVNTNVNALNSHRQILSVGGRQARSAERLSSGQRINRAADDAAGLAISENMRNQIRGLDQATRNSQDGISLVQTAEGALEEVHRILERARQLTNQAANDTNSASDRELINAEISQLGEELGRIVRDTQFNGMNILQGNYVEGTPNVANQALRDQGFTLPEGLSIRRDDAGTIVGLQDADGHHVTHLSADGRAHTGTPAPDDDAIALNGWRAVTVNAAGVVTIGGVGAVTAVGTVGGTTQADQLGNLIEGGRVPAGSTISVAGTPTDPTWTLLDANGEEITHITDAFGRERAIGFTPEGNITLGATPALAAIVGTLEQMYAEPEGHFESETFGVQAGANSGQRINITVESMEVQVVEAFANLMGDFEELDGEELSNLLNEVEGNLDSIITAVNIQRSNLGAIQNRLEHTINSLSVTSENLSAANSRIRDTDMAAEMMAFTQANVLQQAGMSMLAQANQAPQNILQLVG